MPGPSKWSVSPQVSPPKLCIHLLLLAQLSVGYMRFGVVMAVKYKYGLAKCDAV